jgi:hypothetical protein
MVQLAFLCLSFDEDHLAVLHQPLDRQGLMDQ